jgi:hypothetical protein
MQPGKHLRAELNKFKCIGQTFGKIENFKVGDIVFWAVYSKKKTGIISNLYLLQDGGRNLAYATVFCFRDRGKHEVLCVNLKILTKNEFEQAKN